MPVLDPDLPIHVDVETRGTVDLKKAGQYAYAEHPDTDIWCLAFGQTPDRIYTWTNHEFITDPFEVDYPNCEPTPLLEHIANGGKLVAHNYNFEYVIFKFILGQRLGWPVPSVEQWDCTAIRASAMGLPRSLEGAARVLGLEFQKDVSGHNTMRRMARPRGWKDGEPFWWTDELRHLKLLRYNVQDVRTEMALDRAVRPLQKQEEAIRRVDAKINARGIRIDKQSARNAIQLMEKEQKALTGQMILLTNGAVKTTNQVGKLVEWIRGQGCRLESAAKDNLEKFVKRDDVPPHVRRVAEIRLAAGKASLKKLPAMLKSASPDGRARGAHLFWGASSTGRWSGQRIQFQNLPRGSKTIQGNYDLFFDLLARGDLDVFRLFFGDPLDAISGGIRGFVIPEKGKALYSADWSQIEARILAILAGQKDVVRVFLSGQDVYKFTYAKIAGKTIEAVTDLERQLGKVCVLALGYGMGADKFLGELVKFGIDITKAEAEAIHAAYREANDKIVKFWRDLENAALMAVRHPNTHRVVNGITFLRKGKFLYCRLLSGRTICYPFPEIEARQAPWGMTRALTYSGTKKDGGGFSRQTAYGGLLAENVTQATAADVLRYSLIRLDEEGLPVVMHVHDQNVVETEPVPGVADRITAVMRERPPWAVAAGWPQGLLDADTEGPLYRFKK